ncbi:hypothetical protein A6R68_12424, partial [Neotoma lepida]
MFSPPQKLRDIFLSFQEKPHPESDQFTVPHQHLTNKMTPPRKLPENILKLSGNRYQSPRFKSISGADNQLYGILVPPLDSKSSGVTKFIVSPQDLKKDLVQHKKLAKVVVGTTNQLTKSHLQNIMEDGYGDPSITEANSDSLPVQSQENKNEPPEPSEQVEPPEYQLEAQTQDSENLGVVQEGPDHLPQLPEEHEPSAEKEEPEIPAQTPGPLVQAEHFPSLEEEQPAELSESREEAESSESGLESQIQPPEEAEEEEKEPSPIQEEVPSQHPGPLLEDESFPIQLERPAQHSEFLEEEGLGPENQPEALVTPAELPEEAVPPIEQGAPLQAPESPIESVVETPPVHQVQPTQSEEHHYQLPNVTVRPVDVALTITSEPAKETESSLGQQESPVHSPENTDGMEPFLSEQAQLAQSSELEIPTQFSEYAPIQQEQAAQSSEHHEVTVSPSTHHSNLSTTTGKPADMQLTITPTRTAEVGPPPMYHEALAKPITVPEKDISTSATQYTDPTVTPEPFEGVELLSNQQEAPTQSLEPVQYEKPSLSQQEDTDEDSELQEETEPSSAQQEIPVQPLDFPHET